MFQQNREESASDTDSLNAVTGYWMPVVSGDMFDNHVGPTVDLSVVQDGYIRLSMMMLVWANTILSDSFLPQVVMHHVLQYLFSETLYQEES
jgi:hypothetical protein